MWRRLYLLALVLVQLSLAGSSHPSPAPVPALGPEVPPITAKQLCAPVSPVRRPDYRERERLIMAAARNALQGVESAEATAVLNSLAPCLSVEVVEGGQSSVLTLKLAPSVGFGVKAVYGVALWHKGGPWHLASLLDDPIGNGFTLVQATPTVSGWAAVATWRADGSGVIGNWRLFDLGSTLTERWQSPGGTHFRGTLLPGDLLRSTYLDTTADWQLTQSRWCCGNKQDLWQWSGESVALKATRLHPSVQRTALVFAAAINQGRLDRAAELVTDPAVLQRILSAAGSHPAIRLGAQPKAVQLIEEAEANYWEALPPEANGIAPTLTSLAWPAEPGVLHFARVNGEWKVSGIDLADPLCQPLKGGQDEFSSREAAFLSRVQESLLGVAVADAPAVLRERLICVEVSDVPGADGRLLVVRWDRTVRQSASGGSGLAVWYRGPEEGWKVASLVGDLSFNGTSLLRVSQAVHGLEALAQYRLDGSGQIGEFQLLRFDDRLNLLWQGGGGSWFGSTLLSDRLVLTSSINDSDFNSPLSLAQVRFCCAIRQRLLEREGDRFVERATRLHPSLYRTATLFSAWWNRQQWEEATAMTIGPDVLTQMRASSEALLKLDPVPEQIQALEQVEAKHWDALPAAFNGPPPAVESVLWPAAPRPLRLKRVNGEWLVAGWGD